MQLDRFGVFPLSQLCQQLVTMLPKSYVVYVAFLQPHRDLAHFVLFRDLF